MTRKNKTRTMVFELGYMIASVELGTTLAIVTISENVEVPEPAQAHVTKKSWVQNPVKAMSIIENLTGRKGWKWIA